MSTAILQQSSFCDLNDNLYKSGHNNLSSTINMKNSLKNIGGFFDKKTVGAQLGFTATNANSTSGNATLRRTNSGTSCAAALLNPSSPTSSNNSNNTSHHLAALQQSLAAVTAVNGMNSYNNKLTNQSLLSLNEAATAVSLLNKQTVAALHQVAHRKLDRSMSEPVERGAGLSAAALLQQQQQARQIAANGGNGGGNSSRYKTELCRPYEESGSCKYGDKCQFAHGQHEVRTLARHPKYKTELCRTFHTTGLCPYGPRCHFIHNAEEARRSSSSCSSDTPTGPSGGRDIIRHDDGMGSAGNSPHSSDCEGGGSPPDSGCFFEDSPFAALSSLSTPATPTVANASASLFSFHGHEFNRLSSAAARLHAQNQAQKQDAYNRAILHRQYSLGAQTAYSGASPKQQQFALDSRDSVFRDARAISPPTVVLPPAVDLGSDVLSPSPPGSPTGSDTDSSDGSSNTCSSPLDVSRNLRLPIFSQLAINNNRLV